MKAVEWVAQKYRHIITRLELSDWKDSKGDILSPSNEGLRHEVMVVSSSYRSIMRMIQTFLLLLLSDFIDRNSQDITSQPRC